MGIKVNNESKNLNGLIHHILLMWIKGFQIDTFQGHAGFIKFLTTTPSKYEKYEKYGLKIIFVTTKKWQKNHHSTTEPPFSTPESEKVVRQIASISYLTLFLKLRSQNTQTINGNDMQVHLKQHERMVPKSSDRFQTHKNI